MSEENGKNAITGIFNRNMAGKSLPPVEIEVERGRIRFFAQVLGITDPVHFDVEAANAAGYPDLIAPPSFMMVMEALAEGERQQLGHESWYTALNCDFRHLLHGVEAYHYHAPVFAGDKLGFITSFGTFADKKGGSLELAEVILRVEHAERGLLVDGNRIVIHRLG
ncbi:MAG: MaoC family dehydratase N-terminal domain-containing protein [Sphingobium sp.]